MYTYLSLRATWHHTGVCETILSLQEPMPCNTDAETVLHPRCCVFQPSTPKGPLLRRSVCFTDTGIKPCHVALLRGGEGTVD